MAKASLRHIQRLERIIGEVERLQRESPALAERLMAAKNEMLRALRECE